MIHLFMFNVYYTTVLKLQINININEIKPKQLYYASVPNKYN